MRLQAGWSGVHPSMSKRFSSSLKHPDWLWDSPGLLLNGWQSSFSQGKVAKTRSRWLNPLLVPRLRNIGDTSLLSHAFKVWRWTTLLFFSHNKCAQQECRSEYRTPHIHILCNGWIYAFSFLPRFTTHRERDRCPLNMRLSGLNVVWWCTVCVNGLWCNFKSCHLTSNQPFSCMCYPLIKLFTYWYL